MGAKIFNVNNLKKTVRYIKKNGPARAYWAARERIEDNVSRPYMYMPPLFTELEKQRQKSRAYSYKFSILVPTYKPNVDFFNDMIKSVVDQTYSNWELIIADASPDMDLVKVIGKYKDDRIRYKHLKSNGGISKNTNAALEMATGDYTCLLDHDDMLTPDALYENAKAVHTLTVAGNTPKMLYSDEDKYDNTHKIYCDPNVKYNFNFDLLLSNNYICHFLVMKTELLHNLKFRSRFDGSQDYDLVLRAVTEFLHENKSVDLCKVIYHIPKVLYHWRMHEASTAVNTSSKNYAYEAGRNALQDFLQENNMETIVSDASHLGFYNIQYCQTIFDARPDIGIIGGRILDRNNNIASGIYNEKGEKLYKGLYKEYSGGATHRAILKQDCRAVDIRCIRVRDELKPLFKDIVGVNYKEVGELKIADISAVSADEAGLKKLSMELGKAANDNGYLVMWDPSMTLKIK